MRIKFTGVTPILMHSTASMNRRDPRVRELSALTGKHSKKKTDEDHDEIQRLEWLLAMYHDDALGPYLPGEMVFAAIRDGAKAQRLGTEFTRSVQVPATRIKLDYAGPRDAEAMWKHPRFIDARTVKVQTARVLRTRPVFDQWSIEFDLDHDADHVDEDAILRALDTAGSRVGLGDYRPRFGRFSSEVL